MLIPVPSSANGIVPYQLLREADRYPLLFLKKHMLDIFEEDFNPEHRDFVGCFVKCFGSTVQRIK